MISTRLNVLPLLFAASLTVAFAPQSHAGSATYLSADSSRCEIFRALSHTVPGDCATTEEIAKHDRSSMRPKLRGLVVYDAENAAPKGVTQADPPRDLAVAMRIEFHFNSHQLTSEAESVLDRVAEVLNDELMREKALLVEGHADATGPDAYNLTLSQKRAQAVKAYLVEKHRISPSRLASAGKGEAELFDPANPTAGINRRVEFRNLSDGS